MAKAGWPRSIRIAGRLPSESVAGIVRNRRPESSGMGGRDQSESVAEIVRNTQYKSKKRYFDVNDFRMDEQTEDLICPAGEELSFRNRKLNDPHGYKFDTYQAMKTSCSDCKLRSKCLRNPNTESRQVHILFEKKGRTITEKMKEKIDTPEGRETYSKRLGIVEPVFVNIRACKKMDRFTLRVKIKVGIQRKLYCLVHNIEKILNYGESFAMA